MNSFLFLCMALSMYIKIYKTNNFLLYYSHIINMKKKTIKTKSFKNNFLIFITFFFLEIMFLYQYRYKTKMRF